MLYEDEFCGNQLFFGGQFLWKKIYQEVNFHGLWSQNPQKLVHPTKSKTLVSLKNYHPYGIMVQ